jgi:CRISPR/Cas system-associated endoribonuclease Cas2
MNKKANLKYNKKSEILVNILKLLAGGVLIPAVFIAPRTGIIIDHFLKEHKIKGKPYYFKRMLKQAKEKKFVQIIEKNDETFLEITELGKKTLYKYNLDNLKIEKSGKWDKKWRIIIFDIPEKFRLARVTLSNKLKEMGFYRFQKSVFVYPYECEKEVNFITSLFDIKNFVILFEASSLGEYYDLILKKYFDLLDY